MVAQVADLLEERLDIPPRRTEAAARFLLVLGAAALFALCCTLVIALDDIFLRFNTGRIWSSAV